MNISNRISICISQTLPLQLESKEVGRPSINIIFGLKIRPTIQLQLSFIYFDGQTIFGIIGIGNGSNQHFKMSKHFKSISKSKEILGQIFPLILYFIQSKLSSLNLKATIPLFNNFKTFCVLKVKMNMRNISTSLQLRSILQFYIGGSTNNNGCNSQHYLGWR